MPLATLFGQPLRVINLGLDIFAEQLERDEVMVVHVDWRPPAAPAGGAGAANVAALLARLDE